MRNASSNCTIERERGIAQSDCAQIAQRLRRERERESAGGVFGDGDSDLWDIPTETGRNFFVSEPKGKRLQWMDAILHHLGKRGTIVPWYLQENHYYLFQGFVGGALHGFRP